MARTQSSSATNGEEQKGLLEEAFGFVAEQRFYMRQAIQQNDLELAFRYGICLANELRSSRLSPENYYKLYALVFWELQHLAVFVSDAARSGLDIAEVYELAQYEGNVLPRLYMLVTVGAVYVQQLGAASEQDASMESAACGVLNDLSSMVTAVQHPVRGLFLRYYLLAMVKDKLLRVGGLSGALIFLLANFRESVSLWARLRLEDGMLASTDEDQEPVDTKKVWRLDGSRHTLRLLVAAHLMHMARLHSLTPEIFSDMVLPDLLRQCTTCDDPAGKAYLLKCFVEAFPDHFLLQTLDRVLEACAQVHWVIDLKPLLQELLRRFTATLQKQPIWARAGGGPAIDVFGLFNSHLRKLHARPRNLATPMQSLLELQLELLLASLALHPGNARSVEQVLDGTVKLLGMQRGPGGPGGGVQLDDGSVTSIVNILAATVTQTALVSPVLAMPYHEALIKTLARPAWREASLAMVSALLEGDVPIQDCDTLRRLLNLIDPIMHDEGWYPAKQQRQEPREATMVALPNEGPNSTVAADAVGNQEPRHREFDPVVFAAEQECVARLVHQVRHTNPDTTFQMLKLLRTSFDEGGPARKVFTLPGMVVSTLRVAKPLVIEREKIDDEVSVGPSSGCMVPMVVLQTSLDELFDFAHGMCASLTAYRPVESLRLWLLCASTVETANREGRAPSTLGATCNRFVRSGVACMEKEVREADDQMLCLGLLVGTLRGLNCLSVEDYEFAAQRAVDFGSRLPTKRLQSRASCLCAGLYWCPACSQPRKAREKLQTALRLADAAIFTDPLDIGLFIEVLDHSIHMFGDGNEEISPPFVSGLLSLCMQHLRYIEGRAPPEVGRALAATVADLHAKAAEDSRFAALKIDHRALDVLPVAA